MAASHLNFSLMDTDTRTVSDFALSRSSLYSLVLLLSVTWLVTAAAFKRLKPATQVAISLGFAKPIARDTGASIKHPVRPPGVWQPIDFQRPAAAPYPNWDFHKTAPIPYRPFKYGPHYITMGLRTMKWDEWIELDNQFLEWHAIKVQRIQERGVQCCRTAPEAYDGAVELLEELFSYLPQRYPSLYRKTATGIHNLHTNENFSLIPPLAEDPMAIAARLIQDDIAIMFERADGNYYLLAGSILLAGFWRLSDKFGMALSEIHTSGHVPSYEQKLQRGMENFFRRVQPQNPVVRHNYFIQVDDNLAWSSSLGPEDEIGTSTTQDAGWARTQTSQVLDAHHFRSERQTLRRLPRSGGIVFTIRTYFEPITKVAREKGVPGRLASAVRSWGEETARYKGRARYGEVLLGFLDQAHRRQLESGEIGEDEKEREYPL